MLCNFKIWNQGHDGQTMGIRVEDATGLQRLATCCNQPDMAANWACLEEYLQAANVATGTPPTPYSRLVDVVWLNQRGYGGSRYFPGRTLVVTYTGIERISGGFSSQCYCIIDPQGYPALAPHDKTPLSVEYVAHPAHDVIVVL